MELPSRRLLGGVYLACGAFAGLVSHLFGQSKNLEVFRHASEALLAGRDLYDGSSVDWFKYSPTFALFFVPLALVPRWLAAILWGALNFGIAFLGIDRLSDRDNDDFPRVALLAALPGVLLATDGDQANLLVAGAMLLAFAAFEKNRTLAGALLVVLGTLIKIFPLAAATFGVLHRERERSLFRIIALLGLSAALPLVVCGPATLAAEYRSWFVLLRADHATRGWSLVTVVRDLGGTTLAVQMIACAFIVAPVLAALVVPVDARFRRVYAASLLVLIVLTNHRSEYASFVLSAIGVAIWFAEGPRTAPRLLLLALASVAHGPLLVRNDPSLTGALSFLAAHRLFHPVRLVPLVIVWLLLQRRLLTLVIESASARRSARTPVERSA